jgi:hypothetical protein
VSSLASGIEGLKTKIAQVQSNNTPTKSPGAVSETSSADVDWSAVEKWPVKPEEIQLNVGRYKRQLKALRKDTDRKRRNWVEQEMLGLDMTLPPDMKKKALETLLATLAAAEVRYMAWLRKGSRGSE